MAERHLHSWLVLADAVEDTVDIIETNTDQELSEEDRSELHSKLEKVLDKSNQILSKYKIKIERLKDFYVDEGGIDVVYTLQDLKDGELTLDWFIRKNWFDLLTSDRSIFTKKFTLDHALLDFCGDTFIASGKDALVLLDAIGSIQNLKQISAKKSDFDFEDNALDDLSYLEAVLIRVVKSLTGETQQLTSKQGFIQRVKEDEDNQKLPSGTYQEVEKRLEFVDGSVWRELSREIIKKKDVVLKVSKQIIINAIKKLTSGLYKGNLQAFYTEDGFIVVPLEAPYPLSVWFKRRPNGLQFVRLIALICDKGFVAQSINDAVDLINAVLVLGASASNVADEGKVFDTEGNENRFSERGRERELDEDYVQAVMDQIKKPEQQGLQEGYKELVKIVERSPKNFLEFVKKYKRESALFLKDNETFVQWMKTQHPDLLTRIIKVLTGK